MKYIAAVIITTILIILLIAMFDAFKHPDQVLTNFIKHKSEYQHPQFTYTKGKPWV